MLVAVLSVLAGLAMGGYGVYGAQTDRQLLDGGAPAVGTVLSTREEYVGRPRDGIRETIAEVRFSSAGPGGRSRQQLDQVVRPGWPKSRGNAPQARPGESVSVFYDSGDPSQAVVEGWERRYWSWWTAGALFFGTGGALAGVKARQDAAVRRRARQIQATW